MSQFHLSQPFPLKLREVNCTLAEITMIRTSYFAFTALMIILPAYGYSQYNNIYSETAWEERDEWQQPERIIEATGISAGSYIADIGCHEGYMTVKLAKAVGPDGRVYAVDVNSYRLQSLEDHLEEHKLRNVEVIRGDYDDPKLPKNALDAVLILDTYHEMDDYEKILVYVRKSLRPNGKLILIEPVAEERKAWSREKQGDKHEIAIRYVVKDLEKAGFRIIRREAEFIDRIDQKGDHLWLIVTEIRH